MCGIPVRLWHPASEHELPREPGRNPDFPKDFEPARYGDDTGCAEIAFAELDRLHMADHDDGAFVDELGDSRLGGQELIRPCRGPRHDPRRTAAKPAARPAVQDV